MKSSAARVSRSTNAAAYRCANARQISGRCQASPPLSVANQVARRCATDARYIHAGVISSQPLAMVNSATVI
jgi:hypothetical protein